MIVLFEKDRGRFLAIQRSTIAEEQIKRYIVSRAQNGSYFGCEKRYLIPAYREYIFLGKASQPFPVLTLEV